MANNVSLGVPGFGVSNALIPIGGPKTVPALLDFSNTAEVEIDGEQVVSLGKIEYLQGVFIDNGSNTDPLTLIMAITGQRIVCPPNYQGYFNILVPNPPRITASTTQAANRKIPLFFYNVPIQAGVWSAI